MKHLNLVCISIFLLTISGITYASPTAAIPIMSSGDTLYVDASNATPTDGTTWAGAFTKLQDAIDISNASGGGIQIWVAEGTYRPTLRHDLNGNGTLVNRERTFYITRPVSIYGGFTSGDTQLTDRDSVSRATILTGDLNNNKDTAHHVMILDTSYIDHTWHFDGLTIRDGRADSNGEFHGNGAGIYSKTELKDNGTISPLFTNCNIQNNKAAISGGGFYGHSSPLFSDATVAPTFINCDISDNHAIEDGGGIFSQTYPNVFDTQGSASPVFTNCDIHHNTANDDGGAIFCESIIIGSASPVFTDCTIHHNMAGDDGAGIHTDAVDQASPTLAGCAIYDNQATQDGGGVYIRSDTTTYPVITTSNIYDNTAGFDGAGVYVEAKDIVSMSLMKCHIYGNQASVDGGGIYIISDSIASPIITNSTIYSNTAGADGAGIHTDAKDRADMMLLGCQIYGNQATRDGGGMYFTSDSTASPMITNSNIYNNTAGDDGGGIYIIADTTVTPVITNCNIHNNSADDNGGGMHSSGGANTEISPIIANTILWENKADKDEIDGGDGDALSLRSGLINDGVVSYSLIQSGGINGTIDQSVSNISDNPLFVNTAIGDYRLQASSPAINAGINDSIPAGILTDIAGLPRIRQITVDMGSHEGVGCIEQPITRIYVDANGSNPTDGLTWATALTDLQEAIDLSNACSGIQEIWVAEGTYRPSYINELVSTNTFEDKSKTFYISQPVLIYGGFSPGDTELTDRDSISRATILTGNLSNGLRVYHVMTLNVTTPGVDWLLDGLTIRDGLANHTNSIFKDGLGSGIYILGSSAPDFANCNITRNTCLEYGAGIYVENPLTSTPSPTFTNCDISHNHSQENGGGISFDMKSGLFSPTFINCNISSNSSAGSGGGIYFFSEADPLFVNCNINKNRSHIDDGGGIYFSNDANPVFTNCSMNDNIADRGGALAFHEIASLTISNSILWNNTASNGATIFISDPTTSTGTISYSIIQPSGINGTIDQTVGNISDDPLFVDAAAGDYRLDANSPAINTGINDSIPAGILTDITGLPRIRQGTVDMGSHEGLGCTARIYVDANSTNPIDGFTWAGAVINLQEAIDVSNACTDTLEIWVAEGTYRPTLINDLDENTILENREKTFYITEPVSIYGGFTSGDTELSDRDSISRATILTGDLGNGEKAYHVMTLQSTTIDQHWHLDGLTIRDGQADGNDDEHEIGGGIYIDNSSGSASPIFSNININNNTARFYGGGIEFLSAASPTFTNTNISNNIAGDIGGGIDFANIANPTFINTNINNNDAGANGGGMYFTGEASPSFINTSINNNIAGFYGGGIIFFSVASPSFTNTTISNNSAIFGGGLDFSRGANPTFTNTTISNNTARGIGGGILFGRPANPTFINTNIISNNAGNDGGGLYFSSTSNTLSISNSILWDNQADPDGINGGQGDFLYMHDPATSAGTISYSLLQPDGIRGTVDQSVGNIADDPLFVTAAAGDYRLQASSPAINAGINDSIPAGILTDIAGLPRVYNGIVDMGAHEAGCGATALTFSPTHSFGMHATTIKTDLTITADNMIIPDQPVIYRAKGGTLLNPNFEVKANSILEISTEECDNQE